MTVEEKTEKVWESIGPGLERAPVPGGWLYRTTFFSAGTGLSVAMAFVPGLPPWSRGPR